MLERADMLDPELTARLAGAAFSGPPTPAPHHGVQPSPRRGIGMEFAEHVEYSPGHEISSIDWKVFARSDRYYVKQREDERLRRVVFVMDTSASMTYGAASALDMRGSKHQFAAKIVTSIARCLVSEGDAVGLMLTGDGEPVYLPPSGGMKQFEALFEIVSGGIAAGNCRLSSACAESAERLKRNATMFIVSDFLDEDPGFEEILRGMLPRGISPRLIHVMHSDEVELPQEGTTRFIDIEGDESLVLDPDLIRKAYNEEVRGFLRQMSESAAKSGIPYAFCETGRDPAEALTALIRSDGRSGGWR
ncbi:MAG: DUF58 domain-containing protein [Nitrospirae bacterium]|nr:DUF58 domain-containing protein [Nitrospirota bacterium]